MTDTKCGCQSLIAVDKEVTMKFHAGDRKFDLSRRVLLMGILNVTPDSFSENGVNQDATVAIDAGLKMVEDGADVIDVGGESTRPNATPVDADEEMRRIIPVIKELTKRTDVAVSVDTWKSNVAEAAVDAGASIINDVTGFRRDPKMKTVAAKKKCGCVAMHMRGTPQTMQSLTKYDNLVREINDRFRDIISELTAAGVAEDSISLDPGIGFAKTTSQNLTIIQRLDELCEHGRPILLGPSRKSFIGKILDREKPVDRIWGTAAVASYAISKGAGIIRVHDVPEMRQVIDMATAIKYEEEQP